MTQAGRRFQLEERLAHLVRRKRESLARWMQKKDKNKDERIKSALLDIRGQDAGLAYLQLRVNLEQPPPLTTVPNDFPITDPELLALLRYMSDERRRRAGRSSEEDSGRNEDLEHDVSDENDDSNISSVQETSDSESELTLEEQAMREFSRLERDERKACWGRDAGLNSDGEGSAEAEGERFNPDTESDLSNHDDSEALVPATRATHGARQNDAARDSAGRLKTMQLADKLFRALAGYHMQKAQITRRAGERGATKLVLRFGIAMGHHKTASRKALASLNAHLKKQFRSYRPMTEDTLFDETTRDWASCVATEGDIDLPWWTEQALAKVINAFDFLMRLFEENTRLWMEVYRMEQWIDRRIDAVVDQDRNVLGRSSALVVGELIELRSLWFTNQLAWNDKLLASNKLILARVKDGAWKDVIVAEDFEEESEQQEPSEESDDRDIGKIEDTDTESAATSNDTDQDGAYD